MRIGPTLLLANALLALAAPAAATEALDLYRERALVSALDRRCDLLSGPTAAALDAATAQARGAALRGGADAATLDGERRRAERRAAAAACDGADAATIRTRVERAFGDWSRTPRLTLAGDWSAWRAERGAAEGWRLVQTGRTGASPVAFGLPSFDAQGPAAVVSFVGAPRPYGARLVFRDAERTARPSLDPRARVAKRTIWASSQARAPSALLGGRRDGEVWRFPAEAIDRLAELDPRERFTVEFVFRDDSVARAEFEVGELIAGRAFVQLGPLRL
ncbi:hypothetical protein [Brevundimonas balnearis]|uniref:Uncharacterized protein n=1 Tax=Brevundimonas balnearis TaxID=1572858 RepID=A0ABV6R5F4_9CAUL